MNEMLKIELSVSTLDAALIALSKFPYDQAAPHINAIHGAVALARGIEVPAQMPVDDAPAESSEGGNAD